MIYVKGKNMEVQSSKQTLINKHITNIDTEVVVNAHWLQRAFTLAGDVIKNGTLNAEQRYHYDQLQRHLLGTTLSTVPNNINVGEQLMNGIQPEPIEEDVDGMCSEGNGKKTNGSKRFRMEEYDLDDLDGMNSNSDQDDDDCTSGNGGEIVDMHTTFKMPTKKTRANLNETQVLSMDANVNATFYMASSGACNSSKKNMRNGKALPACKGNLVTNVLSEQIVKGPSNSEQLKNGEFIFYFKTKL